jgi:hypothetical protein
MRIPVCRHLTICGMAALSCSITCEADGQADATGSLNWIRTQLFSDVSNLSGPQENGIAGMDVGGQPMLAYPSRVAGENVFRPTITRRQNGVWSTIKLQPSAAFDRVIGMDAAVVGGTPYVVMNYADRVGGVEQLKVGVMALRNDVWTLEYSEASPGFQYGRRIEIGEVGGQPAVAYTGPDASAESRSVMYLQRDATNTWTRTQILNGGSAVTHLDVQEINGKPSVLATKGQAVYGQREGATWTFKQFTGINIGGDLIPYQGAAGVFGSFITGSDDTSSASFFRETGAAWNRELLVPAPSTVVGSEMRLIDDTPMLVYSERLSNSLHFRTRDQQGWNDQVIDFVSMDETDNVTLFKVNGQLAIAHLGADPTGREPLVFLETTNYVPEPTVFLLFSTGFVLVLGRRRLLLRASKSTQ